jgi:hypothetical protein
VGDQTQQPTGWAVAEAANARTLAPMSKSASSISACLESDEQFRARRTLPEMAA